MDEFEKGKVAGLKQALFFAKALVAYGDTIHDAVRGFEEMIKSCESKDTFKILS